MESENYKIKGHMPGIPTTQEAESGDGRSH